MSGTGTIATVIPAPSAPLVDEARNITVPWRAYLLILQRRTGGTAGASTSDNVKLIALERTGRINADQALQAALDAEQAARIAGDDALSTADATLNLLLSGVSNALSNEIVRATQAEAMLVPISELCSMWAACDLSFLPTTNPGGGKPWNDSGHLAITPVVTLVGIGLEDDTGTWELEDAAGAWIWG